MFDNSVLHLVYLLQSGCTHNDLKEAFPTESLFDPISLWKGILDGTFLPEMKSERREKIMQKAQKLDTEKIQQLLENKNIHVIHWFHPEYPERLKTIGHAPFFLFVQGILRTDIPLIGVVGSRKNTPYAKKILEKIIPDMIQAGVGIISGGATGVDSIGHEVTLEHGGYTIAVVGTGIDRYYPSNHKTLFENIVKNGGTIISQFPLGTGPEVYNFPIRNEVVAAISHGVLIPEAGLSSGTLITAQLALEHGRDVFAVPGDIDRSTSEGTNMLIASGQAKCVRCAGDILEEYFDLERIEAGMTPVIRTRPEFTHPTEKILYETIESGINRVDAIHTHTNLDLSELLTYLSLLEISGHITLDEMGRYHIA